MNRTDLIGFETDSARRRITAPFELRKEGGSAGGLTFKGYASTTETEYPVFGGTFPGWMETMASGSFKRTLNRNADVAFLINHEGLTLARTKSGTMTLREDKTGLAVTAQLDPRQNVVNDLFVASERGDIDEMSFAFRVVEDQWFDDNGDPASSYDGTKRRITEVNLNKGDVSAVNYGANDTTSGGFREAELALAELRDGREISEKQRDVIRALARSIGEQPDLRAEGEYIVQMDQMVGQLETIVAGLRAHVDSQLGATVGPDGTAALPIANSVKMFDGIETLAAARAQWELRRDITAA